MRGNGQTYEVVLDTAVSSEEMRHVVTGSTYRLLPCSMVVLRLVATERIRPGWPHATVCIS